MGCHWGGINCHSLLAQTRVRPVYDVGGCNAINNILLLSTAQPASLRSALHAEEEDISSAGVYRGHYRPASLRDSAPLAQETFFCNLNFSIGLALYCLTFM